MGSFIGRSRELQTLASAYASPSSQFIPVYGRRRVGKSELILQFVKGKPYLYYLGKKGPPGLQRKEFLEEAARTFGQPLLSSVEDRGWREALDLAMRQHRGRRKLVLVLDEFQWMVEASPELPSVLQELWDRQWRRGGTMLLILCGSYLGFMEREVLGEKSPLFGRRTGQIFLKPFSYREAAAFHPRWSLADKAKAYFLCGGIPLYLRYFSAADSIQTNIEKNFLDEFAALYREPEFLLREELRELEKYHAILLAVSTGGRSIREIARLAEVPERNVHYYAEQLIDLGYLSRRHPLSGRRPAPRDVRLALEDPMLRFWFRFVYPNLSYVSRAGPKRAYQEIVRPEIESYYGTCFERLCREALPALYEAEGVGAAYEVGEYWSRDVQIDVVGYRKDGRIDIGECRWGRVRSLGAVRDELVEKAHLFPNPEGATIGLRVFTRERVPAARVPEGIRHHSLEDLYRDA